MTTPSIRLDIAARSTVITCTACPWWSEITTTPSAAHTVAAAHETAAHPGHYRAHKTATQHARRAGEKQIAGNVAVSAES